MLFSDTFLEDVKCIDRAQFDTIEKKAFVLYIVDENDGFSLYLGNKELKAVTQRLEILTGQLAAVRSELETMKRRLGLYEITYPDADGDGKITSADASLIMEFVTELGAGSYANYPTQKEKWEAFAEEKEIENSTFPDIFGKGGITSENATIIQKFTTEVGSGTYMDTEEGFDAFMMDYCNVILGGVSGIRRLPEDVYKSVKKRDDILYIVAGKNGSALYLGDVLLKTGSDAVISTASLITSGISQSEIVIGKAEFEAEEEN